MVQRVVVQAVAPFSYEGRARRPGELVTMRPIDAAVAHRRGEVSLTRRSDPSPAPALQTAALGTEPPRSVSRRRYRRRDVEPEP